MVVTVSSLLSKAEKGGVFVTSGPTDLAKEMVIAPAWRPVVVQHGDKRRETRKKAGCFPLRGRIPGLKCVNSEVNSVSILPNGFLQVGPWHHVGATMEFTLDKT